MSVFEELLSKDGKLVYKTKGSSMRPMLRENRDLVVIVPPVSRLLKFDVAFYRRGEQYVLHRVIGSEDGYYRIRGDNTFSAERVPDKDVIGVLTSFRRKGKTHAVTEPGYRFYARFWNAIYPLRALWFRVKRCLKSAAKKFGLLPFLKKPDERK